MFKKRATQKTLSIIENYIDLEHFSFYIFIFSLVLSKFNLFSISFLLLNCLYGNYNFVNLFIFSPDVVDITVIVLQFSFAKSIFTFHLLFFLLFSGADFLHTQSLIYTINIVLLVRLKAITDLHFCSTLISISN